MLTPPDDHPGSGPAERSPRARSRAGRDGRALQSISVPIVIVTAAVILLVAAVTLFLGRGSRATAERAPHRAAAGAFVGAERKPAAAEPALVEQPLVLVPAPAPTPTPAPTVPAHARSSAATLQPGATATAPTGAESTTNGLGGSPAASGDDSADEGSGPAGDNAGPRRFW